MNQKFSRRLVGQDHPRFDRPGRRLGVEVLNGGEDEPADFGEQAAVVPKIWTQNARDREDELPMRQAKQKPLVHILRKQERPFLRAGRAEIVRLTGEWPEVFIPAVGICALDAGDPPSPSLSLFRENGQVQHPPKS